MVQYCDLHECEIDRRGCPWCLIESLEQQLQQARKDGKAEGIRLGWEQAKREAIEIMKYTDEVTIDWEETFDKSLDAIASMTYKEAQDD